MPDGDIDVFISYKKEEADKAQRLVEALQAAGYSAVYDVTGLNLNDNFADKLESLIRRAKRVVVLWTKLSCSSEWVRDEARLAKDLGKYLGVVVEPETDIALDLRNLHKIDITRMTFHAGVDVIAKEIADQLGPGSLTPEALAEASFFRTVEAGASRGGYEAFLGAHPSGRYAEKARQKLAALPRRRTVPAIAALSVAVLMAGAGYFAAGYIGPQKTDLSQVAALTDKLDAAMGARDKALTAQTDAEAKAKRLSDEVKDLTGQVEAAAKLRQTLDGVKADIARLAQERDEALTVGLAARAALADAEARVAELEAGPTPPAPQKVALNFKPAKPDCRTSSEAGIEILGKCYPLSTTSLSLRDPQFVDASPLSALTSLRRLFLVGTQITDASPLSGLTSLQRLALSGTQVTNLAPLHTLTNLHYLRTTDGKTIGSANDSSKGRKIVADYIAAHSE